MAGEEAIGSVAGVCFVGGVKGHDECMRVGIPTADSSVIRCGIYFRPVAFAAMKFSNVCSAAKTQPVAPQIYRIWYQGVKKLKTLNKCIDL